MRTPHDRFVAYVYHRQSNPTKHVPEGITIPTKAELTKRFGTLPHKGDRAYKRWLKKNHLDRIEKLGGNPYKMWHDGFVRNLIAVDCLREVDDARIAEHLWKQGRWRVSVEEVSMYRSLFFDVEPWQGDDFNKYLETLEKEDYEFFDKGMSQDSLDVVLRELGVNEAPLKIGEIFDRFLMKALYRLELIAPTPLHKIEREFGVVE